MKPVNLWTNNTADIELLRRCKKAITDIAANADVVLYGSRARGHAIDWRHSEDHRSAAAGFTGALPPAAGGPVQRRDRRGTL